MPTSRSQSRRRVRDWLAKKVASSQILDSQTLQLKRMQKIMPCMQQKASCHTTIPRLLISAYPSLFLRHIETLDQQPIVEKLLAIEMDLIILLKVCTDTTVYTYYTTHQRKGLKLLSGQLQCCFLTRPYCLGDSETKKKL